jgi:hypothetical protein
MEFDELKKQWEGLDAKLDSAMRLNRRVLDERVLNKAGSAMNRLGWLLALELALGVVAVLLTGSFVADHIRETRFLVPGLVLHVFGIAQIGALVRQIVMTRQIDYAAPLVEIQKRIESLEIFSIWTFVGTLLVSPLLWTALLIVVPKGTVGIDVYTGLGVNYIVANGVFGLALIAVGLFMSRRYAGRFSGSPLGRKVMRGLSGYNLTAARRHLEAISQFEKDDPSS